ncbi:hypothetical protein [Neorhizobium sp. DT-125]|uniref:hypothetical protein n=1 Tax=Neorhizobium sp. DT-125 TaxID=3396163 RepID=UPI003F1C5ED0
MEPEERVKRYEKTLASLREDVEWLRATRFWTDEGPNENLIEELERAAAIYVSLVKELSKPPG